MGSARLIRFGACPVVALGLASLFAPGVRTLATVHDESTLTAAAVLGHGCLEFMSFFLLPLAAAKRWLVPKRPSALTLVWYFVFGLALLFVAACFEAWLTPLFVGLLPSHRGVC